MASILLFVLSMMHASKNSAKTKSDSPDRSQARSSLAHRLNLRSARDDFERSLDRAISGRSSDQEAFKKWMIDASAADFLEKLDGIRYRYEADPITAFKALEETFRAAALENPGSVLRVLDILSVFPEVTNLERDILHTWLDKDQSEVLNHMADPEQMVSEHTISILSSLYQNENSDSLDDFLTWGNELKEKAESEDSHPAAKDRWQVFLKKLSRHSSLTSLHQVATYLTDNTDSHHAVVGLTSIIPKYIELAPEDSLDWLRGMDLNNEQRSMVMGTAMQALSKFQPEAASNLLNADQFIEDYYQPTSGQSSEDVRKQQEKFYDDMLQNFLLETLSHSPEIAIENSQMFFDSAYRESIVKIAEEYIAQSSAE